MIGRSLIIQLNYHQPFVPISSRWTEKRKKYTPPSPLSAVGTQCHRIALGMIHTCTGGQRLITPSIRLSVVFFVFFTTLGSLSVPLTACDPRLNTLSSSTSGVYLRTSDTSISPGSVAGETSINPVPFQKPHGEICKNIFWNNFHLGKYSQIAADNTHPLHELLPPQRSRSLRKRGHPYILPRVRTERNKRCFVNRCLFNFI